MDCSKTKPQGVGGRGGMRRSTGVSWYGAASIADLGSSSKYSTLASFTLGDCVEKGSWSTLHAPGVSRS